MLGATFNSPFGGAKLTRKGDDSVQKSGYSGEQKGEALPVEEPNFIDKEVIQ